MALIGYARVSTVYQNLVRQIEAIGEVGELFIDKASRKDAHRPQLAVLCAYLHEGSNDVVCVKSVDRLDSSRLDLLDLLQELDTKGVKVDFVGALALSASMSSGQFILTVLVAVVEFECELIRECQRERIVLAKVKGKCKRGLELSASQIDEARWLVDQGAQDARSQPA